MLAGGGGGGEGLHEHKHFREIEDGNQSSQYLNIFKEIDHL
jgi:hypothetical protein